MSTPPHRATRPPGARRRLVTVVALLPLVATPVAAQEPLDPSTVTGLSMAADALVGAIVTLLIGGGLVVLAPAFTERTTDRVHEAPARAFLWGLAILVAALVVAVLLAITIVGILLVVPLVVALGVLGTIGFLAAGRAVFDDRGRALFAGVVVAAIASGVPYVGSLLGFVLGCTGVGAWYLDYRDDGSSPDADAPDVDPVSGARPGSTVAAAGSEGGQSTGVDRATAGSSADRSGSADAGAEANTGSGDAWTAGFDEDTGPE